MKKNFVYVLFMFLTLTPCFSQKSKVNPSYSFFKLIINNEKGDILLVNWNGKWEVPGLKYNSKLPIKVFVEKMARRMGVDEYENFQLRGLFTFHYENRDRPTIMNYYSVQYLEGHIKPPPGCTEASWFSVDKAKKIIAYEEMKEIISMTFNDKCSIFGGAIKKYKDTVTGENRMKFLDSIHKMSSCKVNYPKP